MKTPAIVAVVLVFCAISFFFVGRTTGGTGLETRTFELQHMNPYTAAEAIAPYVYSDRPGASGQISTTNNLLTVRETRDNLDKIARVLEQYDVPPANVQLHFQIIAANGASETDSAIADVESVLRRLFRFEGYQLIGQTMLSGIEQSTTTQIVAIDPRYALSMMGLPDEMASRPTMLGSTRTSLNIHVGIEIVWGDSDSGAVSLRVNLGSEAFGEMIETSVNARAGQTVVLGSAQPGLSRHTLILTVRPEIVRP